MNQQFSTTHWSLIKTAQDANSPENRAALEQLCASYWQPLYSFVRSRVEDSEKAADLTQGFFAHLLEKRILETVSNERGSFRSFLLVCIRNLMNNEYDRQNALKRGGNRGHVSFDVAEAESRFAAFSKEPSPETMFEKQWAWSLLKKVHERLDETSSRRRPDLHQALKSFLTLDMDSSSYDRLQVEFGISRVGARVAVHRLRESFRKILREEVAATLGENEGVEEEIARLLEVLTG